MRTCPWFRKREICTCGRFRAIVVRVKDSPFVLWGPGLSPFLLKLESALAWAGLPWRRLPRDWGRLENLRTMRLVNGAVRRGAARRPFGDDEALDEYPLVPFLVTPSREVFHDSSAIAAWIDREHAPAGGPLFPPDGALGFLAAFLDEAFDEFGLYMVHHNRWAMAAGENDRPGLRLAGEFARHIPPGTGRFFALWFEARQTRRLPYLFSVAPKGHRVAGLPDLLAPPSREGFPPTHEILDSAWEAVIAAIAALLRHQPFLLGDRFTIADASAYGQLSMNLTDGVAARRMSGISALVHDWLENTRDGNHVPSRGDLRASPDLARLLAVFVGTFVPLMRANESAYEQWKARGETLFNEKAFDAGRALYDADLAGRPFRHVVKTFQVRTWRDLCARWSRLDSAARAEVAAVFGIDPAPLFAPASPDEARPVPGFSGR